MLNKNNYLLEQRRATKRNCIRRLKAGQSMESIEGNLTRLSEKYPYNKEYYKELSKGLNKIKANL